MLSKQQKVQASSSGYLELKVETYLSLYHYSLLTNHRQTVVVLRRHVLPRGAKSYAGHTGSVWDWPAKTIKAGVQGVPRGENMIALGEWQVRYLMVREAARVQCFPDEYVFAVSWSESMRQIGNAVPVTLAQAMIAAVLQTLRQVQD